MKLTEVIDYSIGDVCRVYRDETGQQYLFIADLVNDDEHSNVPALIIKTAYKRCLLDSRQFTKGGTDEERENTLHEMFEALTPERAAIFLGWAKIGDAVTMLKKGLEKVQ